MHGLLFSAEDVEHYWFNSKNLYIIPLCMFSQNPKWQSIKAVEGLNQNPEVPHKITA